jgi:hypothetical protein
MCALRNRCPWWRHILVTTEGAEVQAQFAENTKKLASQRSNNLMLCYFYITSLLFTAICRGVQWMLNNSNSRAVLAAGAALPAVLRVSAVGAYKGSNPIRRTRS